MRNQAQEGSVCPDQGAKGELASNDDFAPLEPVEYVSSEIANGIPEMPDDEYQRLKEDIRLHGQKEPIRVRGHDIIDGRSRYRACKELNLPVNAVQVEDTDKVLHQLSFSLNVHRRHLTQAQKAALIVEMTPNCAKGRPKKSAAAAGLLSRKDLAKQHQVSQRSIEQAAQVHREDPEIHMRVKSGGLSLDRAVGEIQAKRAAQNNDFPDDANVEPPDSPDGPVDAVEVKGANEKLQKAKKKLLITFHYYISLISEDDRKLLLDLADPACEFLESI